VGRRDRQLAGARPFTGRLIVVASGDAAAAYHRCGVLFPLQVIDEAAALERGARYLDYWKSFDAALKAAPREEQSFIYEQTHLVLPWVGELVCQPEVLDVAEQILGPDLVLWLTQWFVKLPGATGIANGLIDWHQDEAYWGFDEALVVTAWIALSTVTADNGAMKVIRGSHAGPLLEYEEGVTGSGNVLSRGQRIVGVESSQAIDVCLRPGQMSVHHPRMVHASSPNRSTVPRINLVARFAVPSIDQQGPNPPEGVLVRGADRYGIWRLLDPSVSAGDLTAQRAAIGRVKENTHFVAAAKARPQDQRRR
jgi:non-heme Fe2+,alpha-ketoglutarate-dependent halogenase